MGRERRARQDRQHERSGGKRGGRSREELRPADEQRVPEGRHAGRGGGQRQAGPRRLGRRHARDGVASMTPGRRALGVVVLLVGLGGCGPKFWNKPGPRSRTSTATAPPARRRPTCSTGSSSTTSIAPACATAAGSAPRSSSRPRRVGIAGSSRSHRGRRAMRTVEIAPSFEDWQAAARTLLHDGVPPAEVRWRETAHGEQRSLLTEPAPPPPSGGARVPRKFLDLPREAAVAADPTRWQVLYEVLWRLVHENRDLLAAEGDPTMRRLKALSKR